mmetsp:Transcript_62076/g.201228  ORF Transcript_62076/g.201228 Transcript_62076/m.201228 type:complete len:541 (-) Transcript_62076:340-1962(-)
MGCSQWRRCYRIMVVVAIADALALYAFWTTPSTRFWSAWSYMERSSWNSTVAVEEALRADTELPRSPHVQASPTDPSEGGSWVANPEPLGAEQPEDSIEDVRKSQGPGAEGEETVQGGAAQSSVQDSPGDETTGLLPPASAPASEVGEEGAAELQRLLGVRAALIDAVFGAERRGVLPARSVPDAVKPTVAPGVDALVWNMSTDFHITSTVFYAPVRPGSVADTAFLFHQGHHHCRCRVAVAVAEKKSKKKPKKEKFQVDTCRPGCVGSFHTELQLRDPGYSWWDLDNVTRFLHSFGFDVFILSMPLWGVNRIPGWSSHGAFLKREAQGDYPLRYFLEPSVLTVNYAVETLGTKRILAGGLSGGGWATTMLAAMDPRVDASFNVGGSIPWHLRERRDISDFESICGLVKKYPQDAFVLPFPDPGRPACRVCDYECQYTLAGLGPGRFHVQLLHEHDSCCYATAGRHGAFQTYEGAIRARLAGLPGGGWFTVVATNHSYHEVSLKDRHVISTVLARLPMPASSEWDSLPCDLLNTSKKMAC